MKDYCILSLTNNEINLANPKLALISSLCDILPIVNDVLKSEAGYVNDPHDSGGETIFGISRKYHSCSIFSLCDDVKEKNKKIFSSLNNKERNLLITREVLIRMDLSHYQEIFKIYSKYFNFIDTKSFTDLIILYKDNKLKISKKCIYYIIRSLFFFSVNAGVSRANYAINTLMYDRDILKLNDYDVYNCLIHTYYSHYIMCVQNKPSNIKFLKGWKNRVIHSFKDCEEGIFLINKIFIIDK